MLIIDNVFFSAAKHGMLSILPKNRTNIDQSQMIFERLNEMGLTVKIEDYYHSSIHMGSSYSHLYAITVQLPMGQNLVGLIDYLQDWIDPYEIETLQRNARKAQIELDRFHKTTDSSTTSQSDFIIDFTKNWIEEMSDICLDRKTASKAIYLLCYKASAYTQARYQEFESELRSRDVEEVSINQFWESFNAVKRTWNRDESLLSTFERLGSNLPSLKKIRNILCDLIERVLDEKFGALELSEAQQHKKFFERLCRINGVSTNDLMDPRHGQLIREANSHFPDQPPLGPPTELFSRSSTPLIVASSESSATGKSTIYG